MRRASLFLVHLTGIYLRWAYCSPRTGRRPLSALIDLKRREKRKLCSLFLRADGKEINNDAGRRKKTSKKLMPNRRNRPTGRHPIWSRRYVRCVIF